MQIKLICPICDSEFVPKYSWQKYCCKECGKKASNINNIRRYDRTKEVSVKLQSKKSKIYELVEQDYLKGIPEEDIAEKYDITVGVVLDICQQLWEYEQIRKNWDSRNNLYGESILQMFQAEETISAIAEKFSVQPISIRKVAKEKHFKIPTTNYQKLNI